MANSPVLVSPHSHSAFNIQQAEGKQYPPPHVSPHVHQAFNLQNTKIKRSPFVDIHFTGANFSFSEVGMLDSGSTTVIIPYSRLPKKAISAMAKPQTEVNGIGGYIDIVGEINCSITLGKNSSPAFPDLTVLITTANIPILIGQNVLDHGSLEFYTVYNKSSTVKFHRILPSGRTSHTAAIIPNHKTELPPHINATNPTARQPDIPCPSVEDTLQRKLDWLKNNSKLTLPNHPNRDELEALVNLLLHYKDIIGTDDGEKGTFIKPVRIPTNGQSRNQRQHPIAQALEEDVDAEIMNMATRGIIEPCEDPKGFNSPVFAVRKKNGKVRVVANFKRTLNKVLVDLDPYPIPTIEELFNKVGLGNKYFSSLDLRNSYWQIVIDERDRHKTAFTWKGRCYQYTRLAFGLTSAGQIFSRCIADALHTTTSRQNISSYIDDNLVHAKTFTEHINALQQLFKALREFGLKLNPEKCTFIAPEAKFLGRIIDHKGFRADPEYTKAITEMSPPTTRKELQSFIGRLVWIRQFLETNVDEHLRTTSFSKLMAPIHELNRSTKSFSWTEKANTAFEKIKKRLASPPIISFPDFAQPFTLTTDASDVACGAILMQETKGGQKRIVAVASRTFSITEQNWSTTEREAYAIKWGIAKFDYFLRNRPFVIFTDHRSLTYLDQREFNNAKIRRWQEEISPYRFVLEYLEGESNIWADMLSRGHGQQKHRAQADTTPAGTTLKLKGTDLRVYIPSWCLEGTEHAELIPSNHTSQSVSRQKQVVDAFCALHDPSSAPSLKLSENMELSTEQIDDTLLSQIIKAVRERENGKEIDVTNFVDPNDHRSHIIKEIFHLFYLEPGTEVLMIKRKDGSPQMVIPYSLRAKYLRKAHDGMNHSGFTRMRQHLAGYWWELKNSDIKAYVDSCETCARCKGNYGRQPKGLTGHCKRGERPFEIIYIDFVTMPQSKGKRYILTILDSFSRHLTAVPCARDRAIDAARGLYSFFLRHREIPNIISSDRGTHFTGEVYKNFCDMLHISQALHCPWRPQSSGNIERQHRTLKNALYMLCEDRNCEWTDILESVVSSMNATINSATGASPHYVITGRHPNICLPRIPQQGTQNSDPGSYGMQVNALLRQVNHHVKIANSEADRKMEDKANHNTFQEVIASGDKVLLHRPRSATALSSHLPWIGRFTVVKSNDMVLQIRDDKGNTDWVHRSHVRRLVPRPAYLDSSSRIITPIHSRQAVPARPQTPVLVPQPQTQNTPIPRTQQTSITVPQPQTQSTPVPRTQTTRILPNRRTRGRLPSRFDGFNMDTDSP